MYLKSSEVKPGFYKLKNKVWCWKLVEVLEVSYSSGLFYSTNEGRCQLVPKDGCEWQWEKVEEEKNERT